MCFFYAIKKENTKQIIQHKITTEKQLSAFETVFFTNGFENPLLPVITDDEPEKIQLFEWGLIPDWLNDATKITGIRNSCLNAKVETVFEKKSFSKSILTKRCLVLCSGFFENFHKNKKEKYSFYISLKDDDIFCLAGIYNVWRNPDNGKLYKTYSVLTQPSNELLSAIHNTQKRQPVILDYQDALKYISKDLSKPEIENIISKKIDFQKLKAIPIVNFNPLKSKEFNNEKVSAYYHYPELVNIFRFDNNFTEEVINCIKIKD